MNKQTFLAWAWAGALFILLGAVAQTAASMTPAVGSALDGQIVFQRKCTSCHSLTENRYGPSLGAVYGRQAGTAPGYTYSNAFQGQTFRWREAELDQWLQNPQAYLKGARMGFRETDPQKRADVIAYLKSMALHP